MAKQKPKCCKSCLFSRWYLTKAGHLRSDATGRCVVPQPDLTKIMPYSITGYTFFTANLTRMSVAPGDGAECPLYQENPGKLLDGR